MPILDKISLYFFFFTFFVYLVVPVACANPTLSPPSFVFGEFINLTGYQPFVAFMVGLSGVTTAFGGTDAITHIAEEVMTPEKDIPRSEFGAELFGRSSVSYSLLIQLPSPAMWLTVVIGFSSTFVLLISLLFAVKDIDSLLSTPTGQPYLQLLFDATESFAGTACMASLILVINGLAIIGECIVVLSSAMIFRRRPLTFCSQQVSSSLLVESPSPWRVMAVFSASRSEYSVEERRELALIRLEQLRKGPPNSPRARPRFVTHVSY